VPLLNQILLAHTGMMVNISNPTEVLRYMRNEIYARNGYRFSNEQLFNYFSQSGDWYHPKENQSELNLSPIEKLNIQLIRFVEEDRMKQ
jgi:hypothetical protein